MAKVKAKVKSKRPPIIKMTLPEAEIDTESPRWPPLDISMYEGHPSLAQPQVQRHVENVKPPTLNFGLAEPDPLTSPQAAIVFGLVTQRMLSFAQRYPSELRPEPMVRLWLARLCAKDPRFKVYVALNLDTGEVIGHCVGSIETNGVDTWLFCWQIEVDQSHTGIVDQIITVGSQWAKSQGATSILMATQIDPEFWKRRYGFESMRTVMSRQI